MRAHLIGRSQVIGAALVAGVAAASLVPGSAMAATPKHYTVTAKASTHTVTAGHEFTIKGKVSPKTKGEKVMVESYSGKKWTAIASATAMTRKDSRYTVRVRPSVTGKREFRIEAVASKHRAAGYSSAIKVTVDAKK